MSEKRKKAWYETALDMMDEILVAVGFILCLPFFIGFGIPAYQCFKHGGCSGSDADIYMAPFLILYPLAPVFLLGLFFLIGIPILRMFRISVTTVLRGLKKKQK